MSSIDVPPDLGDRFAARLARARARTPLPGPSVPGPSGAPDVPPGWLSSAQRRMWLLHRMRVDSAAYNIPVAWRLRGPLDAGALRQALHDVAERHAVLRTTVVEQHGEPVGVVAPATALQLTEFPATRGWLAAAAARPFALDWELPLRAALAHHGPQDATLLLTAHHIAVDGWSVGLLAAELSAAYGARVRGAAPLLGPARGYAEAAFAIEQAATAERRSRGLDHWRTRLTDVAPPALLPTDGPRPRDPAPAGRIRTVPIPPDLTARLRRVAAVRAATPFMVLLAGLAAAYGRWTGQDDLVIGTAVAGRDAPGLDQVVGCFINTVPLRLAVAPTCSGGALLDSVRDLLLADLEHADVPFEQIVEAAGAPRGGPAGTALFELLAVATNVPRSPLELVGIDATSVAVDPGAAKVDLAVSFDEIDGQTELALTYRTELFDEAAVDRFAGQYLTLLQHLLRDPEQPIGQLPMLGDRQARQILDGARGRPHPAGTVLSLIDAVVAARPDSPAVVDARTRYSYAELDARARAIAAAVRAAGAATGHVVGVLAERSADTVAAILGVLRAGAGYLPVEPDASAARVADLLAGVGVVVGRADRSALAGGRAFVPVDVAAGEAAGMPPAGPADLAYVMPTSGSTGMPKGVEIEHRHLCQYVRSMLDLLHAVPGDRFAFVSTFAADLGHTGLFGALCSGGLLHVCGKDEATDGAALATALGSSRPDHVKIVPGQLAALLDTAGSDERAMALLPRRTLVMGGEAASWSLIDRVRRLAPDLRVLNHYGPTECTVGALTWEVRDAGHRAATVPLGHPLPHVSAAVLDPAGRPVPVGVPGELYLGGSAVARGYRGDPEQTAARFVPGPDGGRWYRTGDRTRLREDGTVEFCGRLDDQVKIRGFRVEPGEVTAVLRLAPGVRDAVVVARQDDGETRLVGYLVADAEPAAVAKWLSQRLPAHLVPSTLVPLASLPLTPNGKVDRRALPRPVAKHRPPATATTRPRTQTEATVLGIWEDLLGLPIGVEDDFFAVGGHSLLAARVIARIRTDCGVEVPLRTMFDQPQLVEFAAAVEGLIAQATPAGATAFEEGEL